MVTAPAGQSSDEGSSTLFNLGSFSDPGVHDNPWTVDVNWGDGSTHSIFTVPDQSPLGVQTHSYDDNGTYTVIVTVTDKDHGSGSNTFTVSVANVAPTAAITGAPASSPEGTPISLGSTATDPSHADTTAGFTKAWSVTKNGGAYASGTGAGFSFTPNDNGTYVVTFSATDKDGGTGADQKTIDVTNVAPTAAITGAPASSPEGTPISLGGPQQMVIFLLLWRRRRIAGGRVRQRTRSAAGWHGGDRSPPFRGGAEAMSMVVPMVVPGTAPVMVAPVIAVVFRNESSGGAAALRAIRAGTPCPRSNQT